MFDKKSEWSGVNIKVALNQQLADESHKPIIRKFEKCEIFSSFMDVV